MTLVVRKTQSADPIMARTTSDGGRNSGALGGSEVANASLNRSQSAPPRPQGDSWRSRMWDNLYNPAKDAESVAETAVKGSLTAIQSPITNVLRRDVLAALESGQDITQVARTVRGLLQGNVMTPKAAQSSVMRRIVAEMAQNEPREPETKNSDEDVCSSEEQAQKIPEQQAGKDARPRARSGRRGLSIHLPSRNIFWGAHNAACRKIYIGLVHMIGTHKYIKKVDSVKRRNERSKHGSEDESSVTESQEQVVERPNSGTGSFASYYNLCHVAG